MWLTAAACFYAVTMEVTLTSSPPAFLCASPLQARAYAFAADRHAGGLRWDGAPFLLHPLEVASILKNQGSPEDVVAAGILHDVLEKTGTTVDELIEAIGHPVATMVVAVSDDASIADYAERKRDLRERAAAAGDGALAVLAADKVAKVRELRAQLVIGRRIDAEARQRLDHYEQTLELVRARAPDLPPGRQLEFELWALAEMPPAA